MITAQIGQLLIIIGFILGVIPYLLIFGAPIYLVGTVIYWTTKQSLKSKIYWTFLPMFIGTLYVYGSFWIAEMIREANR